MASLRRELNTLLTQCFHTGHSFNLSKISNEYISIQKEGMGKDFLKQE